MPPQMLRWSPQRLRKVVWGTLTMLTCPCCIPIWLALLSGTAAGALLREHVYWAVGLFFIPFVFFAWKAIRSYGSNDCTPNNKTRTGTTASS